MRLAASLRILAVAALLKPISAAGLSSDRGSCSTADAAVFARMSTERRHRGDEGLWAELSRRCTDCVEQHELNGKVQAEMNARNIVQRTTKDSAAVYIFLCGPKEAEIGAAAPTGAKHSAANGACAAGVEKRLADLYTKYNPAGLGKIPMLLRKYAGMEEQLVRSVIEKYTVDTGAGAQPAGTPSTDGMGAEADTVGNTGTAKAQPNVDAAGEVHSAHLRDIAVGSEEGPLSARADVWSLREMVNKAIEHEVTLPVRDDSDAPLEPALM